MIAPIDPTAALGVGSDWNISGVGGLGPDASVATPSVSAPDSGGFGSMLAQEVGKLTQLQDNATSAAQSLADGTATDPSAVVTAVEKAQLAMQLAGQIRTKGAEAISDIFHTQI